MFSARELMVLNEIATVVSSATGIIVDIISETSVAAVCGINPQLWADCVGGAAKEEKFVGYLIDAGYVDIELIRDDEYFSLSNSESTRKLTATFGAKSAVFRAREP
ncbi:MAG TPA: hypothetical protein EYG09_05300 [Dehalococcoidia bacterium]|nr:hypothetical protein [Dehalococcoidia bacterium]